MQALLPQTTMFDRIAARFAGRARTPKGARALRAIFQATRELVARQGLNQVSLDAIADQANLTQAALRHYFPTRDELLTAFFVSATEWFRGEVESLLRDSAALPAGQRLERSVSWHLEYMEHVESAVWLESSAFWLRQPDGRQLRDDFYRWLLGRYMALIGEVHPGLPPVELQRRALAAMTMVLGAWITHGRGSAMPGSIPTAERRQYLVARVIDIALG
jgi:AcrR family transcriptional regulator